MLRHIVIATVLCVLVTASAAPTQSSSHDPQYFRQIIANHFTVPPGTSAFALTEELTPWLASPDPALRDDTAYTILDVWIRHGTLTDAQLLTLLPPLQQNLTVGIGDSGTDSVLKRSFSALTLASLAQRNLEHPFLSRGQYRALLTAALNYLRGERDNRGFDPVKGWIHSAAHTADLLAALASDPHFTPADQQALFAAVEHRLRSATAVYTYSEQGRLGVALLSAITRDDFQLAGFQNWLATLQQDSVAWQKSPPDPIQLALVENHTYLLEAMLARMPTRTPLSPAAIQARDAIREALRNR
jgi:Protein of unknown function (DUF2785)